MIAAREVSARRAEERAGLLEREAADLRREREGLQALLAEARAAAPAPRPDGLRVVVVDHPNGQEGYRRAVEELGGEFVFLEGGDRVAELKRRVWQADAVIATVGGMSHKAFYVIRSWCGASGTPFEPAESTGYAGVAAAARRLARRLARRGQDEAGRGETSPAPSVKGAAEAAR